MRRDVIRGGFEAAREFHALAPERKHKLAMGKGFVGYLASGDYTVKTSEVNANTKADINAAFFFDRERMADDPEVVAGVPIRYTNKWPHELPLFRGKCLRYFYAMKALARSLLPAIATGLGANS
jgi:isopenicillin N synthase-like dioxygenase